MFFSRSQYLLGGLAAKICELLEKAPQGQPPARPCGRAGSRSRKSISPEVI
ncbi:MAG: hypothetical protein KME26_13010 [Oscillatoria princeps RMCB-10]|jgi:hypothetical protein|nr:hypothetical protein [Oscillatoria princeps RMCB-10]